MLKKCLLFTQLLEKKVHKQEEKDKKTKQISKVSNIKNKNRYYHFKLDQMLKVYLLGRQLI